MCIRLRASWRKVPATVKSNLRCSIDAGVPVRRAATTPSADRISQLDLLQMHLQISLKHNGVVMLGVVSAVE